MVRGEKRRSMVDSGKEKNMLGVEKCAQWLWKNYTLWLRKCKKKIKNKMNIILGRGVRPREEIFKLCKIEKERNHTTHKRA